MTDEPKPQTAIDLATLAALRALLGPTAPPAVDSGSGWGKSMASILQAITVAILAGLGTVVVATSNTTIRLEEGVSTIRAQLQQKHETDSKQDMTIGELAKVAAANTAAIEGLAAETERTRDRVRNLEGGRALPGDRRDRPF